MKERRPRLAMVTLALCLFAASCTEPTDVDIVLSDDGWEPASETIDLGEELVDNCLNDTVAFPGRGAILERTYRRDLTERVGASLGVEAKVAAEVEASLEITLGEEFKVSFPSDGSPVPARDIDASSG